MFKASKSLLSLPKLRNAGFLHVSQSRLYHHLIQDKAFINGKWTPATDGAIFEVRNPANGNHIASVPHMSTKDAELAVNSASKAFQSFKNTTGRQRSLMLQEWLEVIKANADDLAKIMTLEMGKPLTEAKGEVAYGYGFVEWFSEEAKRFYGDSIPSSSPSKRLVVIKQPVGVCGMITPWNFPNAMVTRKVSAAIAAGCTCVLKPAEDTPLSALALAKLADEAGIPPGVFNVVTCDRSNADSVGHVLSTHSAIQKLSFTGSSAVGKFLMTKASSHFKRVSMELGGNAPFIVFKSADLDSAVQGLMAAKFRASGQTCVCANRVFVHEDVCDEFVGKLSEKMSKLVVGDGFKEGVNQGPLINNAALQKVDSLVSEAVKSGARLLLGGAPVEDDGGYFYQPTLLTDVTHDMRCSAEEIFGPVVPVIRFSTNEEVIEKANSTQAGLAGYFYTQNMREAWLVAEHLQVGMVAVNDGMVSAVESPFGGIKQSGIGREGSKYGIDEYLNIKSISFGL